MKIFKKKCESKWHNKPCEYDGIKFASEKERDRYIFLKSKENCGEISNLRYQVKIELVPAIYKTEIVQLKTKQKEVKRLVQKAIYYIADFVYERAQDVEYEDIKGSHKTLTKVYVLKKKMMLALKGIEVKEVYTPTSWVQSKPKR